MPRIKAYNKQEVLEKAMNLFWKNGYEVTSMHQLEKEMGINKFSIYSSFGSKNELFKESVKCYATKLNDIVDKLQNASGGVDAIQQYFFDFIKFSNENNFQKGCLVTNTMIENIEENKSEIQKLLSQYTQRVRDVFAEKLREVATYTEEEVQQKADYYFIAMFGFSSATKIFTQSQITNYIHHIFNK